MEGLFQYCKVLKVTTLVTFGFRTLLLSLLSEARYFRGVITFRRLKCVLHMGTSKSKIAKKNVTGILFEKS